MKDICPDCGRARQLTDLGICTDCEAVAERVAVDMAADREHLRLRVENPRHRGKTTEYEGRGR